MRLQSKIWPKPFQAICFERKKKSKVNITLAPICRDIFFWLINDKFFPKCSLFFYIDLFVTSKGRISGEWKKKNTSWNALTSKFQLRMSNPPTRRRFDLPIDFKFNLSANTFGMVNFWNTRTSMLRIKKSRNSIKLTIQCYTKIIIIAIILELKFNYISILQKVNKKKKSYVK